MTAPDGSEERLRLDKWLFFARIVRTRVLAQELAESGHVRVNGVRVKASSKAIKIGDVLTVALDRRVRVLEVLAVAERRGGAEDGAGLYREIGEGAPGRPGNIYANR
jgi:ribosome-associated heat shock protein Hsp15